jgi:ABC-2 type transport system permease protein
MWAYFTSIAGYMFLSIFVFLTALFFYMNNVAMQNGEYHRVLQSSTLMFIILIPMLTMRLFAEEIKQKTDQMLFTSPVKIYHIVLAKFLSAVTMFLIAIGFTMLFPLLLSRFGEIPVPQIAGAYVGYILLGICFISIGLFISVLTENQIVAAVATFSVIFFLNIIDGLYMMIPADRTASMIFLFVLVAGLVLFLYNGTKSKMAAGVAAMASSFVIILLYIIHGSMFDGLIYRVGSWLSIQSRFSFFTRGIFDIADIVYYITFALVFIYLTINVIERRRWK